ncbi:hypothetical protein C8A05DRAFT_43860 [Staphylotrichum tortipilum]|uniref:GH16 domain-containing protein n=1 Tax=Staphylotrichum tortipilum TaxID=2831512 RepID=A0AAN6MMW6_9PEZI|nr:hypothetical protein C8A05DRAFT_43860 [Staphylotrichum longicolle]
MVSLLRLLLLLLTLLTPLTLADCECGYLATITTSTSPTDDPNHPLNTTTALFTDLLETDFTRLPLPPPDPSNPTAYVNAFHTTEWAPQSFNLSAERARGTYGEMFDPANGGAGGDGVQLVVRGGGLLVDGMVPVAELDTRRLDVGWGSFRVSMRVPAVAGTCAAFFWYFNDTQEIDIEFLTRDFHPSNATFPINLVLQSRASALAGFDASRTGPQTFIQTHLPFDPTASFHEYRIDYLPSTVHFYADGALLAVMSGAAVPTSPGHLILQHWSNGNPSWSGGPPAADEAVLAVRYVKAYFNSSMPARKGDWQRRCGDPEAPGAVCVIPDVREGNDSAAGWFFGDQRNMTNNQTVEVGGESGGVRLGGWGLWWGWLVMGGGA